MSEIVIYKDEQCTQIIESISWDKNMILKLIDGNSITINNAEEAGKYATATVYIKNNTPNKYYIMKLNLTDKRLEYDIESAIINPSEKIKLVIGFNVPKNPTKKDVIENAKVNIDGMFVISR